MTILVFCIGWSIGLICGWTFCNQGWKKALRNARKVKA
jgi:hypothetical protein